MSTRLQTLEKETRIEKDLLEREIEMLKSSEASLKEDKENLEELLSQMRREKIAMESSLKQENSA